MSKSLKQSSKTAAPVRDNVVVPPADCPTKSAMQIICKTANAFRFDSMRVEQTDSEGITRIYMVDGIEKSIFLELTTTALNVPDSFSVMEFNALLPLLADADASMIVATKQVRVLKGDSYIEEEALSHFEFSSGGALFCHYLGNPALAPKAVLKNIPVWDIQFEFSADDASLKTAVNHMKRLKKLQQRFGLWFEEQQALIIVGAWAKVPLNVSMIQLPLDHICKWHWSTEMFTTLVGSLAGLGVTSVTARVSLATGLLLLSYSSSIGNVHVDIEAVIPGKDLCA
jgi:hypothetical protein